MNIRQLFAVLAACIAMSTITACDAADARDLAEIRRSGTIRFGVYSDFPPFSDHGAGIDVDIAKAIAGSLGLAADVVTYEAGENMDDDLRNIVWQGRAMGLGPAASDAMLHVPIDQAFMFRNPKVRIFAPYHRETMAVVRTTALLPKLDSSADLSAEPIGAESESIMSYALLSVDGGRLRDQVRHFHDLDDAAAELRKGSLAAVFGTRSQIEPLQGRAGAGFTLSMPPPLPGLPQAGWTLGLAIRAEQDQLAAALEQAVGDLQRSGTLDAIFRKHGVTRFAPL